MEEIEDQLDSDEDDQDFLVSTNSGTGGGSTTKNHDPVKQNNELEQYAQQDY